MNRCKNCSRCLECDVHMVNCGTMQAQIKGLQELGAKISAAVTLDEMNHERTETIKKNLKLEDENKSLRYVLKQVEWNSPCGESDCDEETHCPWCWCLKVNGHDSDCELAKALK